MGGLKHVIRFRCGHVRTSKNTDYRGACRKCSTAGLRAQAERTRKRKPKVPVTPKLAARAVKLLGGGHSQAWVSEALGLSKSSVGRIANGDIHRSKPTIKLRLLTFAPLPLPPRADESPDIHADRSYSLFPPRRTA